MPAAPSVTSTRRRAMPASLRSSARAGAALSPHGRVFVASCLPSEETERIRRVGHEQVLRLLVVVEHHLVVLAADAGLLVAAERGVRRVGVVAVGPDPAGVDVAAGPVGGVSAAGPDTGAEPVQGVV